MASTSGAGGPTRISVNNVGGAGDLTVGDGILVVEGLNNVPTSAVPRAFRLDAPAVAGPYEYLLFRGGAGAGASDDWFLRDTIQPVQPEDGDPSTPPDPSAPPGTPRLRREVSLYAAAPAAAMLYGLDSIETLHERMGGDAQRLGSGSNGTYDGTPDGAWARAFGHWGPSRWALAASPPLEVACPSSRSQLCASRAPRRPAKELVSE